MLVCMCARECVRAYVCLLMLNLPHFNTIQMIWHDTEAHRHYISGWNTFTYYRPHPHTYTFWGRHIVSLLGVCLSAHSSVTHSCPLWNSSTLGVIFKMQHYFVSLTLAGFSNKMTQRFAIRVRSHHWLKGHTTVFCLGQNIWRDVGFLHKNRIISYCIYLLYCNEVNADSEIRLQLETGAYWFSH